MKTKNILIAVTALSVTAVLAWVLIPTDREEPPPIASITAVETAAELNTAILDDGRIKRALTEEPGEWLTYGQTFEEQRFSKLTQIDRDTVSGLGLAWFKPLGGRHRIQNTPLVIDGVMYVSDPWNVTYALDATSGDEIWVFDPQTRREFVRYACCGSPMNRGLAVYEGRVFIATFDGRLVAVNAATGKKSGMSTHFTHQLSAHLRLLVRRVLAVAKFTSVKAVRNMAYVDT